MLLMNVWVCHCGVSEEVAVIICVQCDFMLKIAVLHISVVYFSHFSWIFKKKFDGNLKYRSVESAFKTRGTTFTRREIDRKRLIKVA